MIVFITLADFDFRWDVEREEAGGEREGEGGGDYFELRHGWLETIR